MRLRPPKARLLEIVSYADSHGNDAALRRFDIGRRTLSNYRRYLSEEPELGSAYRDEVRNMLQRHLQPKLARLTAKLEKLALASDDINKVRKAFDSLVGTDLTLRAIYHL